MRAQLGTHFELVSRKDLARLALDEDSLHENALENLRGMKLQVRANEAEGMFLLTAGGDYEAVLLLLPEVWDTVAAMISGDLVVAVPARDAICFTGTANRDHLAAMRRTTSRILEIAPHPLSRAFLRRTEDGWEEYKGFAG